MSFIVRESRIIAFNPSTDSRALLIYFHYVVSLNVYKVVLLGFHGLYALSSF